MTDAINIKDAYIIDVAVNFSILTKVGFNKNDVLLNRGFKITDLEKDRLEKMFETTKNLDKLEAYFQRSRRSLVVMLEDRGINFFSEKQCERCDNFIPQARLQQGWPAGRRRTGQRPCGLEIILCRARGEEKVGR